MWNGNSITFIFSLIAWGIILSLVVFLYRKQAEKATWWKIIIAYFAGIFSFSITFTYFNEPVQLAILPLGLWILFAVLYQRNSWQKYRPYAWLGFGANFIFLLATLIASPLHQAVFPNNELSTFVSDLQQAHIITTHPSASEFASLQSNAAAQIANAKKGVIQSHLWYNETIMTESDAKIEKFPYVLVGAASKKGSGYHPTIYIEKDGKGILIVTKQQHHYFLLSESILSEEVQHD